ncbi:MAG: hypothetical protein KC591_11100 [Gemmatimonadetes bacterium]|nr:hypothetical protein [Gemmatimonadota bacterium]
MSDSPRPLDHALRWLFTLALAWGLLSFTLLLPGIEGAERARPQSWIASYGIPVLAFGLALLVTTVLIRSIPGFLAVPESVGPWRLVGGIALGTLVAAIAVVALSLGVMWQLDPPGARPDDPQHVSLVFWLLPWLAAAWTPSLAILFGGWWAGRGRSSDS